MRTPSEEALAATAAEAEPLRRLQAFTRWVGAGRKLTQTGRITLGDARELVGLLDTGDVIDPVIGDRVFRTTSSEELRGITLIAECAKASGLVRRAGGKLVPVKKHARLLKRPLQLWLRMFEAFPRLGEALCVSGWGESLLRDDFDEGIGAVLAQTARRGAIGPAEAYALAWECAQPPVPGRGHRGRTLSATRHSLHVWVYDRNVRPQRNRKLAGRTIGQLPSTDPREPWGNRW